MRNFMVLAAGIATLAFATPGAAAIMVATYTGTIADSNDEFGTFGAAGSLAGMSYVATYTYDTTIGTYGGNAGYTVRYGGTYYGNASPILSQSLTINRITQSSSAGQRGYLYTANNSLLHEAESDTTVGDIHEYITISLNSSFVGPTGSLETLIPTQTVSNVGGSFQITRHVSGVLTANVYGDFNSPGSVTVTAGAVPEPASWALMIAGFGLVGAASRRRRVALAA